MEYSISDSCEHPNRNIVLFRIRPIVYKLSGEQWGTHRTHCSSMNLLGVTSSLPSMVYAEWVTVSLRSDTEWTERLRE